MARPTTYHIIIMLLILTGQRRNEVAAAVWKEFDLSEAIWTIPKHRTKNSRQHRVPLSPLAVHILRQWRLVTLQANNFCEQRLLFPSSGATGAFSGWSKSKRRLDAASGTAGWTVHDLRRTLATRMAEAKVLPHVIERILNHSSGTMSSIAKVYNRATYEAEMREGLQNWAQLLSPTQECWLLAETDREMTRIRSGGRFSNAPYTKQQEAIVQQLGDRLPILMLFRQNGDATKGWRGAPFWWPVLFPPTRSAPAVFAKSVPEEDLLDSVDEGSD